MKVDVHSLSGGGESTQAGSQPTKSAEDDGNNDFWDDPFLNLDGNEDLLSVNSFNSSMNFAKLQSQINFNQSAYGGTSSEKNSMKKPFSNSSHLHTFQSETDHGTQVIKEAKPEDEISDNGQPRSSVASLISMMNEPVQKKSPILHPTEFPKEDSRYYHGDDDSSDEDA